MFMRIDESLYVNLVKVTCINCVGVLSMTNLIVTKVVKIAYLINWYNNLVWIQLICFGTMIYLKLVAKQQLIYSKVLLDTWKYAVQMVE